MAKSAQDYSVNNPYNPPQHNGKDRPTPIGTQVFPGDNRILTGNTGFSSGPHLHTQAGRDFYAQVVINPTPLEFKPGEVVQVGWGTEWGLYVIVKVNGKYIVYAHLSKADVQPGDKVGMYEDTKYKDIKTAKKSGYQYYKDDQIAIQGELIEDSYKLYQKKYKEWRRTDFCITLGRTNNKRWQECENKPVPVYEEIPGPVFKKKGK